MQQKYFQYRFIVQHNEGYSDDNSLTLNYRELYGIFAA